MPGQDLEEVFKSFGDQELSDLLGRDLVATVKAVSPNESVITNLRHLAVQCLYARPQEYFSRPLVRSKLYDAMTGVKLSELAQRMGVDSKDLRSIDPNSDPTIWLRYLGFFGIDAQEAAPFAAELPMEAVQVKFGLFPHQRLAARRVLKKLDGAHSRVVLHMPTGAGKTRTAIHVVSQYLESQEPGVVVWLAASGELLDQAADAFKSAWPFLGNRDTSLVRFWSSYDGDLKEIEDGLIVAGLQKLHSWSQKDNLGLLRLGAKVKLVVVDEAHQAIATTYRQVIERLTEVGSHHSLLGLTATPGRTWSDIAKDEELSNFFDGNKVMLEVDGWNNPVDYLMEEGYLARPSFNDITYEPQVETQKLSNNLDREKDDLDREALETIGADTSRNEAILSEAQRLIAEGHHRTILFASSVRNAEILSAALSLLKVDAPVVTGETNATLRRRIIRRFREHSDRPMVLCNFGVLTTGFDAPNTSAAIIGRPTRSLVLYSQMVGRATRGPKAGGNARCEISTVVDTSLPGFGDVAEAFTNWEDVWNE